MTDAVKERPSCATTTWSGQSGTDPYHPFCWWANHCKARGCFWQWPRGQVGQTQRGLAL